MNTIFQTLSLDRSQIHWEEQLLELTPVEEVGGVWFKREDYFAPLGYSGINGSKLRQCIYLIDEYVRTASLEENIVGIGVELKAHAQGVEIVGVIDVGYQPACLHDKHQPLEDPVDLRRADANQVNLFEILGRKESETVQDGDRAIATAGRHYQILHLVG